MTNGIKDVKMTRIAVAAIVSAVSAGCLTSSTPERTDWNVECSGTALRVAVKPKFGIARLSLVEMRAPYAVREIAVMRANGSTAFDECNTYAASPVQLMKGVAFDSLSKSGLFPAVVGAGSSVDHDVDVEVAVTRLALDCREEGARNAVAAVSVRLVQSHGIVAYAEGYGSADASKPDYSAAFSAAATAAFSDALNRL